MGEYIINEVPNKDIKQQKLENFLTNLNSMIATVSYKNVTIRITSNA